MEKTALKTVKYIDLLNQTDEQKAAGDNVLKNKEADIALQASILEVEKENSRLETALATAKSSFPYDVNKIWVTQSLIDLGKRQLEFLQNLRKEQF